MAKRILLCLSHSIEEYQQLDLLSSLGYEVASIGGYIDPAHPHDPKRPALDVPMVAAVKEAVDALGTDDNLGAAQTKIPEPIFDWLGDDGIIIYHHFTDRLFGQWPRMLKFMKAGGRVIWRSVGQSDQYLERISGYFREQGLERVAYSPREANIPDYCGHDKIIRFWTDMGGGWTGTKRVVTNVTQRLFQRGDACNPKWFIQAIKELPTMLVGEGSEVAGGHGIVPYEGMKMLIREARAYLYTGTQPASYTLGLIEAMSIGIPIVSIGPVAWASFFGVGPDWFEGHELAYSWSNYAEDANQSLRDILYDDGTAEVASKLMLERADRLFGRATVGADWKAYLG